MPLFNFRAPALPIPPDDYNRQQFDEQARALRLYFNRLDDLLLTLSTPDAGATADRPVQNLQVGQQYFDTDLNLPIWYDGTDWIDAAGNVV